MSIKTPVELTDAFATMSAGQAIVANFDPTARAMEIGFGAMGR